ncbi:MAG: YceI family protein [bacterium]|nr:YceI family protein [bacterium]
MNNPNFRFVVIFLVFVAAGISSPTLCEAEDSWQLPETLDDTNAQVRFTVDSTWHTVRGVTSGLEGKIWIEDSSDIKSLRAEISLPVGEFNTDGESRDERMREVMQAEKFSFVNLQVKSVKKLCQPSLILPERPCQVLLDSELKIRNVSKTLVVNAKIFREKDGYWVRGSFPLLWSDYGVEDPSIIIAKLDKTVNVEFAVKLNGGE